MMDTSNNNMMVEPEELMRCVILMQDVEDTGAGWRSWSILKDDWQDGASGCLCP